MHRLVMLFACFLVAAALPASSVMLAVAAEPGVEAEVDTALVVAVDISNSVDENRYRLQMEGIARALEDKDVLAAITSGHKGAIAIALVEWADGAAETIEWQIVGSAADALRLASRIRQLPHRRGEYTCLARMLSIIRERVLSGHPTAARTVVDVSGDGIDNCEPKEAAETARDALVADGVIINGLPIIVEGENDIVGAGAYRAPGYGLRELGPDTDTTTLDAWYGQYVIGGPGAFLITARGYADFGRAFRQKFVQEVSGTRGLKRASHSERNAFPALSWAPTSRFK